MSAQRGKDGQVSLLYWQAPSTMNPFLSGGAKDIEAASLVLEPLARYDENGNMVAWLAQAIPTLENRGISADQTQITWQLSDGLLWSDGSQVTSEDVKFTWEYCTANGAGCAQKDAFNDVISIQTPDALTAIVTFSRPKYFPYGPFVGAQSPILQKAQFADCLGAAAPGCTQANFFPIGTGPFTVADFRPDDVAVLDANPHYRDPAKPAFGRVVLKGGGTATEAARTVLESGEFDYAWNLQLAPEILTGMQERGKGKAVTAFGTLVERIVLNFTNPAASLGAARATAGYPHPFLTDKAVRQALSMAIDRDIMVEIGYGPTGRITCNILPAPALYASDANEACRVQDIAGANALLDAAGWIDSNGDGTRDRDGQELSLLFQTSTNAVRQDFQLLLQQWWREIGVKTELRNISASVFFGSNADSPDTYQKFFADVQMYAGNFTGTDPEAYLAGWSCAQAPSPQNQWQGANIGRWCAPDYDQMIADFSGTGGLEGRAALARRMNDMLIQEYVVIPLVDRGRVSAYSNSLGGVILNSWDSELWNVADWYRIDD